MADDNDEHRIVGKISTLLDRFKEELDDIIDRDGFIFFAHSHNNVDCEMCHSLIDELLRKSRYLEDDIRGKINLLMAEASVCGKQEN